MAAAPTLTLSNFTGLDFNEILDSILAAGQVPITNLQNEVTADQTSISSLGTIGGDFTGLQNALSAINNSLTVPPTAATTSADAPFTASVTGAPVTGTYTISVSQLASAEVLASQGYTSDTSTVGTGTITITTDGTPTTINITSANDTLDGVASAINSANIGVTAQVVDTGLPGAPYRLQISADEAGTANSFTVSSSLSGGTAPDFTDNEIGPTDASLVTGTATPTIGGTYTGAVSQGYQFTVTSGGTVGTDPITISYTSASGESGTINVPAGYTAGSPLTVADGLTLSLGAGTLNTGDQFSVGVFVPQVSSAQNAEVQVGTEVISSSTNNVTGAIPGVTLQLTNTGGPATVTVASDDNALATQVSNFVSAYNTLISDINTNTQAIPNQTPPPLAADGGLRMELFSLQSALGTINLSNLGITVNQADGSLSFNQTALLTAEASNSSGVTQALGQLYSAINPEVTGALDPNTGVIAAETSSYNSQITDLNNQIATLNQQLQAEQANLQTEFGQIQAEVESYQNISQLFTDNSSSSSGSGGSSIPLPGSNLTVSA